MAIGIGSSLNEPEWGRRLSLKEIGRKARDWQDKNFNTSKVKGALALCEEAGEVARAVNKEDDGIRPETRGDVGDEIGDVLLAATALANRYGLDPQTCVERRLKRMLKLDFTKDPEGGKPR